MNDELQKGNTVSNNMCACMCTYRYMYMYEHNTTCTSTSTCTTRRHVHVPPEGTCTIRVYMCTHVLNLRSIFNDDFEYIKSYFRIIHSIKLAAAHESFFLLYIYIYIIYNKK